MQKPDILNYCLQHCFKPVWIVLIDDPVLLIFQKVIKETPKTFPVPYWKK